MFFDLMTCVGPKRLAVESILHLSFQAVCLKTPRPRLSGLEASCKDGSWQSQQSTPKKEKTGRTRPAPILDLIGGCPKTKLRIGFLNVKARAF